MTNMNINDPKCSSCGIALGSKGSILDGARVVTTGSQSVEDFVDDNTLFRGSVCFPCKTVFCMKCNPGLRTCPKCQQDTEPAYLDHLRTLFRNLSPLSNSMINQSSNPSIQVDERCITGNSDKEDMQKKNGKDADKDERIILYALASQDLVRVKDILKKGCAVNVILPDGMDSVTPLVFAARMFTQYPEFVETLLQYGADPNLSTREGRTALFTAAGGRNIEIARMLIEKGAEVNAGNLKRGFTALYNAVETNHYNMAKFLIERGANVNAKAEEGWTPLHRAAMNRNYSITSLLIESGADVNAIETYTGTTPLSQSIGKNYENIIELLKKHGA